jgi:hypothetical protein
VDCALVRDLAKSQPKPSADTAAPKQRKRVVGRPFPKGVSGNPAGRPKGLLSAADSARRVLAEVVNAKTGLTRLDRLMAQMMTEAEGGNEKARTELLNRAFGMPRQAVEMSGPNGGPIATEAITPVEAVLRQRQLLGVAGLGAIDYQVDPDSAAVNVAGNGNGNGNGHRNGKASRGA